eukprot:CCRYP_007416-RA/>CCRYP_007416-RA protein AED:0.44 eAED:0.44 QI:0/-1/0/1/-1/1/1/0/222
MPTAALKLATKDSEGTNQQEIQFVTNTWCPFAQKAWIALEASHCQYKMREVSLYGAGGKPDWFWELNPKGTVPVVVVKEGDKKIVLDDSEYILEAVMDGRIKGDGRMLIDMERDEEVRQITQWRNIISKQLIPIGKAAVLGGSRTKLQSLLKELDSMVIGPYLTGEKFTVADAAAFPFFWRLDKEYGLGKDGTQKLHAWLERCLQDEAVRKTITSQGWWWWW